MKYGVSRKGSFSCHVGLRYVLLSSDRATGAPLFNCFGIEIRFHSFSPAPTALSRRITIMRR